MRQNADTRHEGGCRATIERDDHIGRAQQTLRTAQDVLVRDRLDDATVDMLPSQLPRPALLRGAATLRTTVLQGNRDEPPAGP